MFALRLLLVSVLPFFVEVIKILSNKLQFSLVQNYTITFCLLYRVDILCLIHFVSCAFCITFNLGFLLDDILIKKVLVKTMSELFEIGDLFHATRNAVINVKTNKIGYSF